MRSVALTLIAALSTFLSMNLAVAAPAASARPPIDLVMLADPSPEVAKSAQRWIAMFSSVGLDGVQIRAAARRKRRHRISRDARCAELSCHGPIGRRHGTGAPRRPVRAEG